MNAATAPLSFSARNGQALVFEDEQLSYAQLRERVSVAATALETYGVGERSVFAVLCENRPEILVAYYAAANLGATIVPINPNMKTAEVEYIVRHSDARLLFHDAAMAGVAEQAVAADRRKPIEALSGGGAHPLKSLGQADSDFLIIYTSGSTGRPKAVVFDQAREEAGNHALIEMWGISPDDRMIVALPLGFLYGLSTAAATGLQAGCEVILLRKFHPEKVISALVSHSATIFHGVPTMFSMMLDFVEKNNVDVDLSWMRLLICAGAPLPTSVRTRFAARFGKEIDDYYALTEVRPVFGRMAGDVSPIPAGAIGKAAPGAEIRIVDENGSDLPDNSSGALLVRAASTLLRYHKDPALTETAMRGDYFATGDLGFRDSAGYYHLTGRIKDIIIRGGANIAPAEVEETLLGYKDVNEAAVIGKPDPIFGEVPIAFVVARGGASIQPELLIEHCRQYLADFKVPTEIIIMPSLPLGVTGKVDKIALRALKEKAQ